LYIHDTENGGKMIFSSMKDWFKEALKNMEEDYEEDGD